MSYDQNSITFSDYLYVIIKWRKLLLINLFIVILISTIVAFIIPETYKSTARLTLPPSNSGLGGLSSILSGGKNDAISLGAKLFGMSNSSEDLILGILYSTSSLSQVIERFNLYEYYGISDRNKDKALKEIINDVLFEPNEYGLIEISVINESPKMSANIANYFTKIVDSINTKLNIENARNNRLYIEKRFLKNLEDVKNAEVDLADFQKKYGVFAIPEQIKLGIAVAGELEAQLAEKQILLYSLKGQLSENSEIYLGLKNEMEAIQRKIKDLNNNYKSEADPKLLIPFNDITDIEIEYLRKYRELEIQNKILEFIYPLYEQAKIEEQKSIPTIMVIDKAVMPQLKYGPKKSFIIIFSLFVTLFLHLVLIFRANKMLGFSVFKNPLLNKEASFYKKLIRFYRMSF